MHPGLEQAGSEQAAAQPSARWEHFSHQADIGVRGIGATKAQAFEQAALGLTAVVTDPALVAPRTPAVIRCEGSDDELLLADWLNALVYEMAVRGWLFSRFEVKLKDSELHGTAWGEPVDIARHQPAVEVKGASYTELQVRETEQGHWMAQCVVDV